MRKDWRAGSQIEVSGPAQARQISIVDGSLLILQLSRPADHAAPTCEYRLSDGALLQRASGDIGASQRLMALCVLGALNHEPALAVMEDRACDHSEDLDVRWEAVRQLLAQDGKRGFAVLARLADDPADPLRGPATSLRHQLRAQLNLQAA